jgi:hypothetical protein
VANNNFYKFYLNSLQAIQRVQDAGNTAVGAGFASRKYFGAGMASVIAAIL